MLVKDFIQQFYNFYKHSLVKVDANKTKLLTLSGDKGKLLCHESMLNGQNLSINDMIVAKEPHFSAIYLQKKATFSVCHFFDTS